MDWACNRFIGHAFLSDDRPPGIVQKCKILHGGAVISGGLGFKVLAGKEQVYLSERANYQ